jgi:hypothetical protein
MQARRCSGCGIQHDAVSQCCVNGCCAGNRDGNEMRIVPPAGQNSETLTKTATDRWDLTHRAHTLIDSVCRAASTCIYDPIVASQASAATWPHDIYCALILTSTEAKTSGHQPHVTEEHDKILMRTQFNCTQVGTSATRSRRCIAPAARSGTC